jgi:hypothetical protein
MKRTVKVAVVLIIATVGFAFLAPVVYDWPVGGNGCTKYVCGKFYQSFTYEYLGFGGTVTADGRYCIFGNQHGYLWFRLLC